MFFHLRSFFCALRHTSSLSAGGFATAGAGASAFGSSDPAAGLPPAPPGAVGFGSAAPPIAMDSANNPGMQAITAADPSMAGRLQQLPNYVSGVMSADPAQHLECTTQFRKMLSIERNPPIQQVRREDEHTL